MKVGQRLFLAVLPAVFGCVLVGALAYWGQYAYRVPGVVVAVAGVAAVASLVVAWANTRYVAERVERLADPRLADAAPPAAGAIAGAAAGRLDVRSADELDVIENVVGELSGAVSVAERGRERARAEARARVREYAALLSAAVERVSAQLDEVRLPLHVLVESQFGELNENQEELIDAARRAADLADEELRRLRAVADLDRGVVERRHESLRLGDLLPPLVAAAQARAEQAGTAITLASDPALPRVAGDLLRLQETLALVLDDAVARAGPGATVVVTADPEAGGAAVSVAHGATAAATSALPLARRLAELQGGRLLDAGSRTVVWLAPARGPDGERPVSGVRR